MKLLLIPTLLLLFSSSSSSSTTTATTTLASTVPSDDPDPATDPAPTPNPLPTLPTLPKRDDLSLFVLECSAPNFGGQATLNPETVTPGVCYDRKLPSAPWDGVSIDTASPFSIGLGDNLACDFHSDFGCKGPGVLKWIRQMHVILRDAKHPMWKEYGFRGDGSGPWSWSCAVVVE